MGFTGCKNWEPNKYVRCGAHWGASSCFDPIRFETKKEIDEYYISKGEKGAGKSL